MLCALFGVALASSSFDPTTPDAVFEGEATTSHDGSQALWSRIERYSDPEGEVFSQEEFSGLFRWANAEYSPHMLDLFGDDTPHSSTFLLHHGLQAATAQGTPVIFVPGAGDNASRSGFGLRAEFESRQRPFYAITFAHPHGDVLQQAEAIADAIAVVKHLTGSDKVDLVAHSKGGPATIAYVSNTAEATWPDADYEQFGTNYRHDVRNLMLIGVPLDGIDTAYRWPSSNFLSLDADLAAAPVSWSAYYPTGPVIWWNIQDLGEQDFMPADGDFFPGQRQLLKRQDHNLPGGVPWLGGFSLQQDWWTTYEGGFGLFSHSYGIDAAIEAGGSLVDHLAALGVDPEVRLHVLAGENPLMPNGQAEFEAVWDGIASPSGWQMLVDSINDHVAPVSASPAEVVGLSNGKLVMGEVSGASDGVVFLTSALATEKLTARGAQVVSTRVVDVSHTELLLASDTMGALMHALSTTQDEAEWMVDRGNRYIAVDTTAYVADQLTDVEPEGSSFGRGPGGGSFSGPEFIPGATGTFGCATQSAPAAFWMLPLGLLGLRRRS